MVFNSFEFLFFFPVVSILYFLFPHAWRWALLLAASCLFYMAFIPKYILILVFTIVVDYFAGRWIENANGGHRKFRLGFSLAANIGVLAYFKYFNFLAENANTIMQASGWQGNLVLQNIILPIGLSFHTFQAMSYTIEVYRGTQRAERHFGIYALYVMFYPQLVAGPIERPQNLLHQFYEVHTFDYRRVTNGLKLMAWGLFKKVVIADRLAVLVDAVYKYPQGQSGFYLALATVAFAYQIYCDFSGYSDMALGAAEVMGFRLMQNFRQPYHARTISEFWRRWHISLSTWFRDYVYIPLGGNRSGALRQFVNLFVTFLISGLWHGAQWTFVAWGALHGLYLGFGMLTRPWRDRAWASLGFAPNQRFRVSVGIFVTFVLVCIGWVFFRAKTMADAAFILGHLHTGWGELLRPKLVVENLRQLGFYTHDISYIAVALLILMAVHQMQRRGSVRDWIERQSMGVRWSIYFGAMAGIVVMGVFDRQSFIYFQF